MAIQLVQCNPSLQEPRDPNFMWKDVMSTLDTHYEPTSEGVHASTFSLATTVQILTLKGVIA